MFSVLLVQGIGTLANLSLVVYCYHYFGPGFFGEFSTVCSAYIFINYFNFGIVGQIRRSLTIGQKGGLEKGIETFALCRRFLLRAGLAWPFLVAAPFFFEGDGLTRDLLMSVALSPIFLFFSILRGAEEGRGRFTQAVCLRQLVGLLIGCSPLMSLALMGTPRHYFFFPPGLLALILLANPRNLRFLRLSFSSWARKRTWFIGTEIKSAGHLEVLLIFSSLSFLYFDRFALRVFAIGSQEIGEHLFFLEAIARISILYVPLALYLSRQSARSASSRGIFSHLPIYSGILILGLLAFSLSMWGLEEIGILSFRPRNLNLYFAIFSIGVCFLFQRAAVLEKDHTVAIKFFWIFIPVSTAVHFLAIWKYGVQGSVSLMALRGAAEVVFWRFFFPFKLNAKRS